MSRDYDSYKEGDLEPLPWMKELRHLKTTHASDEIELCPNPECEDGKIYVSPDDDLALKSGVGIGEALYVKCRTCNGKGVIE